MGGLPASSDTGADSGNSGYFFRDVRYRASWSEGIAAFTRPQISAGFPLGVLSQASSRKRYSPEAVFTPHSQHAPS